jgi:hypothetical protein
MAAKKNMSKNETRALRTQQIISIAFGVVLILSMVLGMLAR